MDEVEIAHVEYLDWLGQQQVIIGRPGADRSLIIDSPRGPCLVGFTTRDEMVAWWNLYTGGGPQPLDVQSLPAARLLAGWAAPGVNLLMDPGPGKTTFVRIDDARRHFGLGPVTGEGGEPVPFIATSGGQRGVANTLLGLTLSVSLLVLGLVARLSLALIAGLAGLALTLLLGRGNLGEIGGAFTAKGRLRDARRRG